MQSIADGMPGGSAVPLVGSRLCLCLSGHAGLDDLRHQLGLIDAGLRDGVGQGIAQGIGLGEGVLSCGATCLGSGFNLSSIVGTLGTLEHDGVVGADFLNDSHGFDSAAGGLTNP
jgi:hypothetical protein